MVDLRIDALLSVLDLTEDEQNIFLRNHFTELYFNTDKWPYWYGVCDILHSSALSERRVILADLAFRLRDELHYVIGMMAWDKACWEVWVHEKKRQDSNVFEREHLSLDCREKYCYSYMASWAQPIHWIVAALIAELFVREE